MTYPVIKKQFELEDYRITYWEGGVSSDAAPLLFVHGWAVSVIPYQELLNSLSQHYRVIAPVLPNLGESKGPYSVWNYHSYAQFLATFIHQLGLKQVHIMGHSLGGGVSIVFSALFPTLVRSLTLIDSTGVPSGSIPQVLPRRLVEMTAQTPQMRFPQVGKIFQAFSYNILMAPQNVLATLWLSLEQDLKPLLPKIQAPTLVLWGGNDMTTPLQCAETLLQEIKDSRMQVLDQGFHEWCLFLVEDFTKMVCRFLNGIEVESREKLR